MPQIYEFPMQPVIKLIKNVMSSKKYFHPYFTKWLEPGLLLVGDRGVYLMSNGVPGLIDPNDSKYSFLVYAKGIDPRIDEYCFQMKDEIWGGDDGCEFLSLEDVIKEVAEQKRIGSKYYTVLFKDAAGSIDSDTDELSSKGRWKTEVGLLMTNPSNVTAAKQRDASLIGLSFTEGLRREGRESLEADLDAELPLLSEDEIWLCQQVINMIFAEPNGVIST